MRVALILSAAFCAAGCASQSSGPVQLAAGQEGNRCTATIEGRPVVFNTDGRDFSQLRGRAVTITASGDLPHRCAAILITALQRAGTGRVTYDFGAAQPETTAREDTGFRSSRRGAYSNDGGRRSFYQRTSYDGGAGFQDRPSFGKGSGRSEWRGSTMWNYQSAKSDRRKLFTKAPSAGR